MALCYLPEFFLEEPRVTMHLAPSLTQMYSLGSYLTIIRLELTDAFAGGNGGAVVTKAQ